MKRASRARYLCSELVKIEWQNETGGFSTAGILEEIWMEGACVQTLATVQVGTEVRIVARRAVFLGAVTECEPQLDGHFSRVTFDSKSRWSPRSFKPEHMVNTRTVLARWIKQTLAETEVSMVRVAGQSE